MIISKKSRRRATASRRSGSLPTLGEVEAILSAPAGPMPSHEDTRVNTLALALTRAHGQPTIIAPDGRVFVEDLCAGEVRLEVRTDRWFGFQASAAAMPNVYVRVYRRTRLGFAEVARRSSGRGLLEGGDLRPALAELLLAAVARRRLFPVREARRRAVAR